jgi:ribosomal-protein-alanine N-acetyltransferase
MYRDVPPLECRVLCVEWKQPLMDFLCALQEAGDSELFHPHAFTEEAIENVINQVRKDVYCVLAEGQQILGYGMLRGWDEGFEIPSLGIAIHPSARGTGLGRVLMHILHASARRKGATRVRLRVKPENTRATKLYEDLGYQLQYEEAGYLVGFLDLGNPSI